MLLAPLASRTVSEALGASRALLALSAAQRAPALCASALTDAAVVLSAHQEARFAVDRAWCARASLPVYRRATSGGAWLAPAGGALHLALALPSLESLAPDATPRNALNRYVRGWLAGITRALAPAHYFGRDWLAVQHRPCFFVGYERAADGALLLEALAGLEAPCTLPDEALAGAPRGRERYLGKQPLSLREVKPSLQPEAAARVLLEATAKRWGHELEPCVLEGAVEPPATPAHEELAWRVGPCAAGLVYARREGASVRVGGDMLAPSGALELAGTALGEGRALELESLGVLGLRWDELRSAWESA